MTQNKVKRLKGSNKSEPTGVTKRKAKWLMKSFGFLVVPTSRQSAQSQRGQCQLRKFNKLIHLDNQRHRQRRRWFSRKYYASVMRLKEFYEENIGSEFCGLISSALSKNFRQNH